MLLVASLSILLWRRKMRRAAGGAEAQLRVARLRAQLSRLPWQRWIAIRDWVRLPPLSSSRDTRTTHIPRLPQVIKSFQEALHKHTSKIRILVTMFQMLTQLQVVFVIPYPQVGGPPRTTSPRARS